MEHSTGRNVTKDAVVCYWRPKSSWACHHSAGFSEDILLSTWCVIAQWRASKWINKWSSWIYMNIQVLGHEFKSWVLAPHQSSCSQASGRTRTAGTSPLTSARTPAVSHKPVNDMDALYSCAVHRHSSSLDREGECTSVAQVLVKGLWLCDLLE